MMQASSMLLLSNVMITTQIQGFLNDHISVESQQWHHYAFSRLMTCPGSQQQAASRQKRRLSLLNEYGRETDVSLNVERMRSRPKFCFRKKFRSSSSRFDRTDLMTIVTIGRVTIVLLFVALKTVKRIRIYR